MRREPSDWALTVEMTIEHRLTVRVERHWKPIVCLVRFEGETAAAHLKTRNPSGPAHGPGVTLEVLRARRWTRAEITAVEHSAIVVRAL